MEKSNVEENNEIEEDTPTGEISNVAKKKCSKCHSKEVKDQNSCSHKLLLNFRIFGYVRIVTILVVVIVNRIMLTGMNIFIKVETDFTFLDISAQLAMLMQ